MSFFRSFESRSGNAGDEVVDDQDVVDDYDGEDGGDGFHWSSPFRSFCNFILIFLWSLSFSLLVYMT